MIHDHAVMIHSGKYVLHIYTGIFGSVSGNKCKENGFISGCQIRILIFILGNDSPVAK